MFPPVQLSHDVLSDLAVALDEIASALDASVRMTDADFGSVLMPSTGFAATGATDAAIASALTRVAVIEAAVAGTAASVRQVVVAYVAADDRARRRQDAMSW